MSRSIEYDDLAARIHNYRALECLMLEIASQIVVAVLLVITASTACTRHGQTFTAKVNGPTVLFGALILAGLYWLGGAYESFGPPQVSLVSWQCTLLGLALVDARLLQNRYNGWYTLFVNAVTTGLLWWAGFWN